MAKNTIRSINKELCTGCKMCADICPEKAILFEISTEGFWYPTVDESKCIKCGLCYTRCPLNSEASRHNICAYAAWNRDEAVRRESTSGGLYFAFAKHVIEEGGYIVGSVYTDDFCGAYHTYSNSMQGLSRIMGSKYFQSDTEGIYSKTRELLEEGHRVLFTGTPCQISALKKFLSKDYDKLLTVDFICRGVPSPKLQQAKIHLYEAKTESKVIFYRDKWAKYAWSDFGELIKFDNGHERFISRWEDDINDCFIEKNLNLRESCYNCKLKDGTNSSEITIGDFWGIKGVTEKDLKLGVSSLIVNNERGQEFIDLLQDSIYLEKRNVDEIRSGNPAYIEAVRKPESRKKFFDSVESVGLEKTVKIFLHRSLYDRLSRKKKIFKAKIRRFIPIYRERKNIDWIKFIKYNYFCRAVHREKDAFIFPCRGTVMNIRKSAKVIIRANVFLNYYPCYKRGSQTTLFSVENNAVFIANNRVEIAFGNTISVGENACLEMGYFFTGVNANVICHCKISIGNRVMIGRDVCIFDSDYHSIYDIKGKKINNDKEVLIEDGVWIGARSMVLKGSHIGSGAIVSAGSMVLGEVKENRVFINKRESKSIGDNIIWER